MASADAIESAVPAPRSEQNPLFGGGCLRRMGSKGGGHMTALRVGSRPRVVAVAVAVACTAAPAPSAAIPLRDIAQLPGTAGCIVNGPSVDVAGCDNTGRALDFNLQLAISPDGRNAYVASYLADAVSTFNRSPSSGALRQRPGPAGCIVEESNLVDVAGCDNTGRGLVEARSLAVSPDGRNVYVGSYNGIAIFDRDQATGELTQKQGTDGCITEEVNSVACATGRGLVAASAVVPSPDGRHVYVASFFGSSVVVFDRDATTGALTQKPGPAGCLGDAQHVYDTSCGNTGRALWRPVALTISPDGENVYTGSINDRAVAVFDRDPATGELTQKTSQDGCVVDATGTAIPGCAQGARALIPRSVTLSPDGENVYVGSADVDAVAILARDRTTGALAQLPGQAGCIVNAASTAIPQCANTGRKMRQPRAVAIAPDGRSAFVAANGSEAIAAFNRNLLTGALVQRPGVAGCVSEGGGGGCKNGREIREPSFVTVSRDGRSAYATAAEDSLVIPMEDDSDSVTSFRVRSCR